MQVLMDNGARMNTATPACIKENKFGPILELQEILSQIPIQGDGGVRMGALGYVVFCVEIDRVPSYDEDQVALVAEDNSAYSCCKYYLSWEHPLSTMSLCL